MSTCKCTSLYCHGASGEPGTRSQAGGDVATVAPTGQRRQEGGLRKGQRRTSGASSRRGDLGCRLIRRSILLHVRPTAMRNEVGRGDGASGDGQREGGMTIGQAVRSASTREKAHNIRQSNIITASSAMKKRSVVIK